MKQILTNNSLDTGDLAVNETLFAQGNGYLGVRGNFEEGYTDEITSIRGNYLNAFYEDITITYGEKLYAFPETAQKLVNLPDAQNIEIFVGEKQERFSVFTGKVLDYNRELDLATGISTRSIDWRTENGEEIRIRFERLVSQVKKELYATRVTLEPLNGSIPVRIVSGVEGDVENFTAVNDPRVAAGHAKLLNLRSVSAGEKAQLISRTNNSQLDVAVSCNHSLSGEARCENSAGETAYSSSFELDLDRKVSLTKYVVFTDSRRHENPSDSGYALLNEYSDHDFDTLVAEQTGYMNRFWAKSDISVAGDEKLQEGIRFNLFQLLQSVGRDSVSQIAAKGLSGEGYEGHYFWDTEIYVLPVFIMTQPELAKNLLSFRYNTLDGARARAKEMGHQQGALFPWRTISGSECSAFFPAGTAQYHISADIAWGFVQHYLATNDSEFAFNCGAEVLFETARLWLATGHFNAKEQFCIDCVTGPDEYTALVNNNYYTNAMAQYNLRWAASFYQMMREEAPDQLNQLIAKIGLHADEAAAWQKAADQMLLPYDESLGINPQDDSFTNKAVWDFAGTPKEKHPLLLHYHPMTLYRYQVCKQADTVLAHYLLDGVADEDTMAASYGYYEKITTHDSSLSSCVFSIMAARLGQLDKARNYFSETARLDLDNTHGNTKDGLHIANLAGTWQGIVFGFGGVRLHDDALRLAPSLPSGWDGYRFNLSYRGSDIEVSVDKENSVIRLISGEPVMLDIDNKRVLLDGEIRQLTIH
ncbi:hypothetical protein L3Q72_18255 [Vibrio sp. JC009]|uniref:glycoside hydrolase family 65 protein n=1 Tax=Vibrio sp. JC009 TaxID=2912314 RepID=UPI0023AFB6EA|nr:glycosyl hydrolase family 65 protein [Vibrio sp. JC009]WED24819.1 hypothetical protein L3Q72_18255 [Vibrio sp. JC009]